MSRILIALLALLPDCHVFAETKGAKPELVEYVVKLLQDEDRDMRAIALEEIRYGAPGESATEQFAAVLPELSEDAKIMLLKALAVRGDSAAKPAVAKELGANQNEAVRVAAIHAVGELADPSDIGVLVKLLSSDSSAERDAARVSLVRARGEDDVASNLVAALQNESPEVQVKLLDVLAERRSRSAFPDILRAAVSDNESVRRAAMKAMGRFGRPEQVDGMVAGVLKAKQGAERSEAEKAVMLVCQRIPNANNRAVPVLAAMDQYAPADQITLLSTLARIGGTEAMARVEQAVASEDPDMHAAGIKALSNWPDASVARLLTEIAKHDESNNHRLMAVRALIRIAPLPDGRSDEQKLALLKDAIELATRDEERLFALQRAAAIRKVETLRFVLPHVDTPEHSEQACLTIVELAHDRGLRDSAKEEFHAALDKVIATSSDDVVIDRAIRYKQGKTWVRPRN